MKRLALLFFTLFLATPLAVAMDAGDWGGGVFMWVDKWEDFKKVKMPDDYLNLSVWVQNLKQFVNQGNQNAVDLFKSKETHLAGLRASPGSDPTQQAFRKNLRELEQAIEVSTQSKAVGYVPPPGGEFLPPLAVLPADQLPSGKPPVPVVLPFPTIPKPPVNADLERKIQEFIDGDMIPNVGQRLEGGPRKFLTTTTGEQFARYRNGADGDCGLFVLGLDPDTVRSQNLSRLEIPAIRTEAFEIEPDTVREIIFGDEALSQEFKREKGSIDVNLLACIAYTFGKNLRIWSEAGELLAETIKYDGPVLDVVMAGIGHFERLVPVGNILERIRARTIEDETTKQLDNVAYGNDRGYIRAQSISLDQALAEFARTYAEAVPSVRQVAAHMIAKRECGAAAHGVLPGGRSGDEDAPFSAKGHGAGGHGMYGVPGQLGYPHHVPPATSGGVYPPFSAGVRGVATAAKNAFTDPILGDLGTYNTTDWQSFYGKLFKDNGAVQPERAFLIGHNHSLFHPKNGASTGQNAMTALLNECQQKMLTTNRYSNNVKLINLCALDAVSIMADSFRYADLNNMYTCENDAEDQALAKTVTGILFTGGEFGVREEQATHDEFEQILDALYQTTKYMTLDDIYGVMVPKTADVRLWQHQHNMFLCAAMMWGQNHKDQGPFASISFIGNKLGKSSDLSGLQQIMDELQALQGRFGSTGLLTPQQRSDVEKLLQ